MLDILAKSMLRGALGAWSLFTYLLGCELHIVPVRLSVVDRLPGLSAFLHWQVWLLAGIVLFATRDVVMDLRCQTCGSREKLSFFRWVIVRRLDCHPCEEQAQRAAALAALQEIEAVPAEYAELFEALK